MNFKVFTIVGIVLLIIGIVGSIFTGMSVVKSYTAQTDYQPATTNGWGNGMPFVEIGFIGVAIVGLALMTHGLVNDPKKEIRSQSKFGR